MKINVPLVASVSAIALTVGFGYFTMNRLSEATSAIEAINAKFDQQSKALSNEALAKQMLAVIDLHEQMKTQAAMEAKLAEWQAADNSSERRIYGSANAPFTLVEFSDLECPYCKRFHGTPKTIVDQSKGMVNWEWKHLPLGFHNPAAQVGAYAVECMGSLKGNNFAWSFIHDYFQRTRSNGAGVESIEEIAAAYGVKPTLLQTCMASEEIRKKVATDVQLASDSGITGTPATFVVDNRTGESVVIPGAQPAEALMAAIAKLNDKYKASKSSTQ